MKKQAQVFVAKHPETGLVVTPNPNKPDYGSFRVYSEENSFEGGFVNTLKKSAFIHGPLEILQGFGFTEGHKMPGKIRIVETYEPQFEGHTPKINPTTQQVVVLSNGKNVYRNSLYTEDMSLQDILLNETTIVGLSNNADVNAEPEVTPEVQHAEQAM